jgi:hypothetical protein
MTTFVPAIALLLLGLTGFAQEESEVSHHLEGLQKQIDQADAAIDAKQKALANDPSLQPYKDAFQQAKYNSDAFYQTNNNKFEKNTAPFAQAQTQQQNLDAAANNALRAWKDARDNLLMKDPELQKMEFDRANLVGQRDQILAAARVWGVLLGLGCAQTLGPKTPIADAKACLDHIYDGVDRRLRAPGSGDTRGTGTPFFQTMQTNHGPAEIAVGLPVDDAQWAAIKKKAWADGFAQKKSPDQIMLEIAALRAQYDRSTSTTTPPLTIPSSLKPATTKYIDVPSPTLPAQTPSLKEIFDQKMQDIMTKMKNMVGPIKQQVEADVAAVRG